MQPDNQQPGAPQQPPVQPRPVTAPPVAPMQQQSYRPAVQPQAIPVQQPVPQPAQQPVARPQITPMPAPQPQQLAQQPIAPVAQLTPAAPPVVQPRPTPVQAVGSVAVADQMGSYDEADDQDDDRGEIDLSEPVDWQAKEYIHQEKTTMWYLAFVVILVAFMALAILLMHSWSFAVLLVVIAVVIIIYSRRPPRVMSYSLSDEGLHIDDALHKYEEFKSFGLIRDGEEFSVMLIPRRRFQPGITVYFPEEAGEDIVDALGSRLPMRDLHLDIIDRIVRTLRI